MLNPDAPILDVVLPPDGGGGREKEDELLDNAGLCPPMDIPDMDAFMLPMPAPKVEPGGGDMELPKEGALFADAQRLGEAVPVAAQALGEAVVVVDAQALAGAFVAVVQLTEDDPLLCSCGCTPGCVGCNGALNCVDVGVSVSKRARSGVTVLDVACCVLKVLVMLGELAGLLGGGGVDHEKDGAVGVLADERAAVATTDAAGAGASQLLKELLAGAGLVRILPLTRASKSSSFAPLLSKAVPVNPPKASISSVAAAVAPFEDPDNSCSFLVCSSSTRRDRFFISSMNVWNCLRSSSGPRLMLHNVGRISNATKSASAIWPTMRRTFRAATMTAGSLVLMALTNGTIFSCMVYLSSAVDEDVFLFSVPSPFRPSSAAASVEPPQRMTNAWRPRTLIAKLVVLLKTVAITGNNSFLMVLKSRTGKTTGNVLRAASTMEWVGHSIAANSIGRISAVRGQSSVVLHKEGIAILPSLNSFPGQLFAITDKFSKTTMSPESLALSFSCACFAFVTKMSLMAGRTLSAKARRAEGSRSRILNTFCSTNDKSSLSFSSSRRAGKTFFSITDLGKDGNTLLRPLRNCVFSLGVLAGNVSRNRIVDTRMLSKNSLS